MAFIADPVGGTLQTGSILSVRGVTHSGERALIFAALRSLTGESVRDSAAAWRAWLARR